MLTLININKIFQRATSICARVRHSIIIRKCSNEKINKKYPRRIFSGIQPTGTIHIGNYLGAVREFVRLQECHEDLLLSIVDLHAMTVPQEACVMRENIYNMMATLIACGINPDKSVVFQQSTVPMHAQLAWIFGCMATMPRLAQFPQFKEKSSKVKDVSLGIFAYPVLQAADILLYKATHVPIGEDQIHHLNFTQHMVNYFNGKFGDTFPVPQPVINKSSGRIKSLREPTKKMSKSSEYKKSVINLIDSPDIIRSHIVKATTDFTSKVTWEPESRPGVSNLVTIHSLITDRTTEAICREAENLNTGQYKLLVADVIIEKLRPIREEYTRLIGDPSYLNDILNTGAQKASQIAQECLTEVNEKIGLSGGILSYNSKYSTLQERN